MPSRTDPGHAGPDSTDASRTRLIEQLTERFPHVPREAVIKEDLLRGGLAFDESALSDNEDGDVKPKSYFIFSFDHGTLPELGGCRAAPSAPGDRAHRRPVRAAAHRRLRTGQPGVPLPCGGRRQRCARALPRRQAELRCRAAADA